jgi:hypothetical protein
MSEKYCLLLKYKTVLGLLYSFAYVCMYVCMYVCTRYYVCMYVCVCVCMYLFIYVREIWVLTYVSFSF